MKLKLFYNGIQEETKIMNAETGEPLENVMSISIDIDAFNCNAVIYVKDLQIDVDNLNGILMNDEELQ